VIDQAVAKRIRLVGLDVDGTLTDGGIYLGAVSGVATDQPLEFKRYDIQDGLGIHLLRSAGIKVVIVTGRVSESVRLRAAELHVDDVAQDPDARKFPLWLGMLRRHGVPADETAFLGDDLPDLAIMRSVGLPVAVANAVPEITAVSAHTLQRPGGRGAVREFAELLLRARGEWDEVVTRYVEERCA
jgi:3-deoxy-D-manno-octulosonate 8-phosphate phosphatase (KDO 8-P phosphatase)